MRVGISSVSLSALNTKSHTLSSNNYQLFIYLYIYIYICIYIFISSYIYTIYIYIL